MLHASYANRLFRLTPVHAVMSWALHVHFLNSVMSDMIVSIGEIHCVHGS